MALNLSVLKTRALTAIVFVLLMVLGIFVHPYLFFLLIAVIHFGAWWEYFNLIDKINNTRSHIFLKIGMAITGFTFLLWSVDNTYLLKELGLKNNFSAFVAAVGFLTTAVGVFRSKTVNLYTSFFSPSVGLVYITLSLAALLNMSSDIFFSQSNTSWLPFCILLPMFTIACMWINDTMAYFVGSLIGKTPLSKISPKKTIEGTLGGIILCGVVAGYAMYLHCKHIYSTSLVTWILIAALAGTLGTIGDLVESKIKRLANVKDSGKFMPGHGGFLDRFDSLLFSSTFMWIVFKLVLKN